MRLHLISSFYVIAAVVAFAVLGAYFGVASIHDVEPSGALVRLWGLLVSVTLISWIISDSRGRTNISGPFCFGALALFLALPYAPYYLVKTRGRLGLLWILGAIALLCVCFVAGFFAALLVSGETQLLSVPIVNGSPCCDFDSVSDTQHTGARVSK